ncbi:chaperone modulator CbpM [Phyllobacterium pellucidum]|uniref:chaperone modulator CbpM n=1 Tax=Phyllobacterium pellucidum TaxID=2740464 RepID=UPI001D14C58C|nr:chaperone modulator CbpM [Phyllobacterium sp. T1018]UGY08558.1 chaperone modulator CbpM [Phyllobacterium sp. T1018]
MFDSIEFCRISGIQQKALAQWIEDDWIRPVQKQGGWRFSTIDLMRAQLILDLRSHMGVNDEGIAIVLHLVDQIHGLRRALRGAASTMVEVAPAVRSGASGLKGRRTAM